MQIGYHLSSEEHDPRALAAHAARAEDLDFAFLTISDHFHPWVNRQGHSPFVWGVIGAIAATTERIPLGTAVTCPTVRLHPAIVAQAAATAAAQMPGRFFLGVGTGERLNEHVLGDPWPPPSVRVEMLDEALDVMRELWTGKMVTRRGRHYTVENARIFTLPDDPPPIIMAAGGPEAARKAAEAADGLMTTSPDAELVEAYRSAGGSGPLYAMTHVCVAASKDEALAVAREWWPNSAIPGAAGQELAIPEHFEPIGEAIPDDRLAQGFVLGSDPEEHAAHVREFAEAGFTHLAIHQVGPDQERLMRFYADEVLPKL